jgi:hypothetical protein
MHSLTLASKRRTIVRYVRRKVSSHKSKITPHKVLKWTIALAPVTAFAVSNYQKAGGGTAGISAALNAVTSSYTGYDVTTGKVSFGNLVVGYVPLFGAWVFGKVAGRILR